ncbi:MAG TPA: biotin transporter BioY [Longimicrobiaceae bacterium]|nr:biotin transporter BioY [Longimicrobiaceae bacterium]
MANTRSVTTFTERFESLASPRTRQVVGVLTFTVLTALAARISLPIPGTVVPFTFQPLAVLLAGALLGARLGAASQVLYLAAGIAGLPVFALGLLLGPSGGYLMAFPVAAFVAGSLVGSSIFRNLLALLAGLAVIYAGGVAWLSLLTGWRVAIATGLLPFLLPDLVKVGMAVVITARLRDRSHSLFAG